MSLRAPIRIGLALLLSLGWTVITTVQPSWACGCGAMIANGPLSVATETSIVRYDDRSGTEQIVMRLAVRSDVKDAAWLFPTPAAAQVQLGDKTWFAQLDRLTEPKVVVRHTWWAPLFHHSDSVGAGAPPGAGSVTVLGEQRLGPFEVATLDTADPSALAHWLGGHGYALSPRLAGALQPYVAMHWKYVAVKLVPGSAAPLNGTLDPLHITFHTGELVYPMRLSHLAKTPQSVRLYVLAPHRVAGTAGLFPTVPFAGWVTPDQVASPGLKAFLGGRTFMTERLDAFLRPEAINDDFHFRYTQDTTFQSVIYETEVVRFLGLPAGWALVLGIPLLLLAVIAVIAIRRAHPATPSRQTPADLRDSAGR